MSLVLPRHLTCKELVELTTLYAEGELDEDDRARFEEHLATCGACVVYYDQMRFVAAAARRVGDEEPEAPLAPFVLSSLLRAFHDMPGQGGGE
jgi:anti-sigma factor RsiW